MKLALLAALPVLLAAQDTIVSVRAKRDTEPTADPRSSFWKKVKPVIADKDRYGKPVPNHRTEIRSRWTDKNLYLLYVCPYEEFFLKPNPTTTEETNRLWEWDVAEAFIGSDFTNIDRYKEFQMSPRGEWVDLDIDRKAPKSIASWTWNSGFVVKARIDEKKKIWYGEMRIPYSSIDTRSAAKGNELRINLYRIQGPGRDRAHIAWQPVNNPSFHTPKAFGRMRLE